MWPALILAANRIDNVTGRTEILTVSTKTRKGLRPAGAPAGKKWAVTLKKFINNPDKIKENHKGSPKENAKLRWLLKLNTYGKSPDKLIKIKIIKILIIKLENPNIFFPSVRLIWLNIKSFNFNKIKFTREGLTQ